MCGIVAILNMKEQPQALRDKALKMSQKIKALRNIVNKTKTLYLKIRSKCKF